MTRVYVDGQEGTTGLQIRQVLATRDDIDVLSIDPGKRKDAAERARLLNAADVAFLCLPDAAAREAVAMVENPATCVIDASTAHRTDPGWAFGLPELARDQRDRIRQSKRIANPGCHATSFVLLIRPLVAAGVLPASFPLTATSITGYSGGGRKMIEQYETSGDARLTSPRPYALGLAHKHLPEMTAHSGLAVAPVFMPVVANFYKGLAVSVPAPAVTAGRRHEREHAARDAGRLLHGGTLRARDAAERSGDDRQPAPSTCRAATTRTAWTSSCSAATIRRCSSRGSTTWGRAPAAPPCSA